MSAFLVTRGSGKGKRLETNSTSQCPLRKLSPEPYCPQRKAENLLLDAGVDVRLWLQPQIHLLQQAGYLRDAAWESSRVQVGPSGYMASGSYPTYTGPQIPAF